MHKVATFVLAVGLGLSVAPAFAADPLKPEQEGALPDDALTPGYANPKVTADNVQKTVCKAKWVRKEEPRGSYFSKITLLQTKNYGVTEKDARNFVMDFRIPLSVGGHPTDPANLWPQRKDVAWNATVKNKLEAYVQGELCAGHMSLKDAQGVFQKNWIDVFQLYCGPKPDAKCNPSGTPAQIQTPAKK